MVDIEWDEPPAVAIARVRTPGRYLEWAFNVRQHQHEHPDKWAVLPEGPEGQRSVKGAENLAQNIRRGATAGFKPKGAFEAVADEGKVWVRYVGEPQPTPPPPSGEDDDHDHPDDDDDESGEQHSAPPRAELPPPGPNPSEVRAWARNNGFSVPDRGRLQQNVIDAYLKAQQRRHIQPVPSSG